MNIGGKLTILCGDDVVTIEVEDSLARTCILKASVTPDQFTSALGRMANVIREGARRTRDTDPARELADLRAENARLQEMLDERTLQHATQLDNANRLLAENAHMREQHAEDARAWLVDCLPKTADG